MSETVTETTAEQPKNDVNTPKPKRTRSGGGGGTGRPRPSATLERDAAALEFLRKQVDEAGEFTGVTRGALAEGIGVTTSEAYLCLYRLGRQDPSAIEKSGAGVNTLWKVSPAGVAYLEKYTQEREARARAAAEAEATPDAGTEVPAPVEE